MHVLIALKQQRSQNATQQAYLQQLETEEALLNNTAIREELPEASCRSSGDFQKKYREIIELLFIEGLGYADISQRLGVAEPTIRKQKERALQQLRAAIFKRHLLSVSVPHLIFFLHAVTK